MGWMKGDPWLYDVPPDFFLFRVFQESLKSVFARFCTVHGKNSAKECSKYFPNKQKYSPAALSMPLATSHFNWGNVLKE